MMSKKVRKRSVSEALFSRVAAILEQARSNIVRTVNTTMVTAYWMIGREIVQAIQGGRKRAEYGQQIIEELSVRLTERYGKGYSSPTLWNFRQFYQVYADRNEILSPTGRELNIDKKLSLSGRESGKKHHPAGGELTDLEKQYPAGTKSPIGFSPVLSWSHYRALMRVEEAAVRNFYENEAAECGWSKSQLERQIQSCYYERIIANRGRRGLSVGTRKRLSGEVSDASQIIKSPYVLEFLGLPDTPGLHETQLEQAIIDNLQTFLLELGKGFSFVARQKHIRFDEDDFYVDLVFYNYILKCFLLIDLKIGKLTHRDVGQMDGYVRLFEDRFKTPGDNPTIGLILCSSKSEAVAKYSVLKEGRQIFASKYLQFLPTEQQLRFEIKKERRLLESAKEEEKGEF
jgi:predicted nuclease of restriction endonuclease-like (RecB) superfamily